MEEPKWVLELNNMAFIPGTVEVYLNLYNKVKSPLVKKELISDMEITISKLLKTYEVIKKGTTVDKCGSLTLNEKKFEAWAKQYFKPTA